MRFLRLGTAGLRGETGSGLNPQYAINFSSAFGTYTDGGVVVVGRDTRISSGMLYHAVISSLLSCGCKVFDAGICPAPMLQFLIPYLDAQGGIMIGAGHHPANWNALVPLDSCGAYLNSVQVQELLDIYHSNKYACQPWNKTGSVEMVGSDAADAYLDAICANINTGLIASGNYTVIADFCNGSGSLLADKLSARLGIRLISLNNELSGVLPHDPEPRPRSSTQVRSIMEPLKGDVGFVFNSDMSRLAVVSDNGETLSEELSFPLVADHVLEKAGSGQTVVTNTCTTRTLDDIVKHHNCHLVKTRVGQAYVLDSMLEHDAIMGGDGSGSVVLRGSVNGYDGFAAMALILESMAEHQCSSSGLVKRLPRYWINKKKISCMAVNAYSRIRELRNFYPDARVSEEDGFRFDWDDGWVHLRSSATEPVIRMIVAWKTREEAEDRAVEIRGAMERRGGS
ncbi:MAG: hypothetical protein JXR78_05165 [Victivallales bacterium]|nr:hypothetical protein [Victivallales bacterium]